MVPDEMSEPFMYTDALIVKDYYSTSDINHIIGIFLDKGISTVVHEFK